ncbi:amino acid ABC transporter permease [Nocardioides ginkgobilobae]
MSGSVLFDAPGPRTIARHRAYTVVSILAIVALLALAVYKLWVEDQLEYDKWEPFVTPRYLSALLLDGVVTTLSMAGAAVLGAVGLGLALGLGKLSDHRPVRWVSFVVVEFFRAVPVLLLMILIFFSWGITRGESGAYWSVVGALALYNGAVLAEIFRAGMNAVPQGQPEAAYALGMRKSQVVWIVQLPQAIKIMVPAIISQCVVALKDTSLGYAVAAPGLTQVGEAIYQQFQNQVPTILVIALLYIAMNTVLTVVATWIQAKYVGDTNPIDLTRAGNMDGGQNTGGAG